MDSSEAKTARSSRRLLFWVVIGVIVLNAVLFLKFGLSRAPSNPSREISRTNQVSQ
jgi:hypothetical protein